CVVLAYGDWSTATPASGGRLVTFKFTHPPASPYLENIIVTIDGAEDRVDELLKTVDWTKLNDALTR
ncbi:MAG TPA: hypothetical protein VG871_06695, partial [Vicinamibacterales bacterium]|nr:hypothetical protein [Vicinamibacterales bacterium]